MANEDKTYMEHALEFYQRAANLVGYSYVPVICYLGYKTVQHETTIFSWVLPN